MKIAIISLPDVNTPVQGTFNNMNGYWNPPSCVNSFWVNACEIKYTTEEQFEKDKAEVEKSYMEMVSQFYRDNAL